ncbi:hypothetical protein As57867_010516, partial [Aphanomyces stellatus]
MPYLRVAGAPHLAEVVVHNMAAGKKLLFPPLRRFPRKATASSIHSVMAKNSVFAVLSESPLNHVEANVEPNMCPKNASKPVAEHVRTHTTKLHSIEVCAGLVYVVVSVAWGFWYLDVLFPSLTNDMWWPDFNASGTQTFLGDVVNLRLAWASSSMTFDLFSSGNGWVKDYSSASAAMALSYVYPRVLLMQSTSNLEDVIRGIHATTLALNMRMLTQYCWADFDKRFELAHTEYRQQRCLDQDADNAAVHLESLLRNVVWSDMVSTYGSTDGIFDVAIGAGVSEFPHGPAWLQSVHDAFVDVATEATYWRAKGAVRWQLPWQNAWQPGVDETITIQNALGMQQKLALKKIPYQHRGPAWTSMLLYYGFWNDISYAYSGGRSLVRNTTTHSPDEMQYRAYAGGGNGPVAHLTRNVLGPYGSIDAKVVPAPASLVTAFAEFSTAFAVALHADSTLVSFVTESTDVVINPVPMSWASPSLAFYGGSLLCVQGNPVDYVQESFGFDDACLAQNELAVTLSATNLAFALIGAQGMASLCS